MSENLGQFKWLNAEEAERQLQRQVRNKATGDDYIDLALINSAGPAEDYELLAKSLRESRRRVAPLLDEAHEHLDELWVIGSSLSDDELRQLGPFLAREATFREDAVFHILHSRRKEVPNYMKRFVTVKKPHVLQYGLASQAGRISLEKRQRDNTTAAREMFRVIVKEHEFEDSFMLSDRQMRVLRALYYIASDPTGSTELFMQRLGRQVQEDGPLSAEELIARFYNFTDSQYDKHVNTHPNHLETEESLVDLLEEGRLHRLKSLGRTVLVPSLGIITAREYKESE